MIKHPGQHLSQEVSIVKNVSVNRCVDIQQDDNTCEHNNISQNVPIDQNITHSWNEVEMNISIKSFMWINWYVSRRLQLKSLKTLVTKAKFERCLFSPISQFISVRTINKSCRSSHLWILAIDLMLAHGKVMVWGTKTYLHAGWTCTMRPGTYSEPV